MTFALSKQLGSRCWNENVPCPVLCGFNDCLLPPPTTPPKSSGSGKHIARYLLGNSAPVQIVRRTSSHIWFFHHDDPHAVLYGHIASSDEQFSVTLRYFALSETIGSCAGGNCTIVNASTIEMMSLSKVSTIGGAPPISLPQGKSSSYSAE